MKRTPAATLLLSSYFTAAELLGDEFDALFCHARWISALDAAANWAIDHYYDDRLAGVDEEGVAGTLWIDEIEPRAGQIFADGGAAAVEAFYLAALVAILDDYWTQAAELVAADQAPELTQLHDLARRAASTVNDLPSNVRDAAAGLARAWHSMVERIG